MFGTSPKAKTVRVVVGRILFGFLWLVLLTLVLPVGMVFYGMFAPWQSPQSRAREAHPEVEFTRVTSLEWPSSAKVVAVDDQHGGWTGDGEFLLVFDVDTATLARWLARKPPWGDAKWTNGPVPENVAGRCFFSSSTSEAYRSNLSLPQIQYSAQDLKLSDIPWHNGRLLAFNPASGRVYLCCWDF